MHGIVDVGPDTSVQMLGGRHDLLGTFARPVRRHRDVAAAFRTEEDGSPVDFVLIRRPDQQASAAPSPLD